MSFLGKLINRKILPVFNLQLIRNYPRPFTKIAVKGEDLIGVEIGVLDGENAESILKTLDIKKLYLVDPYEDCLDWNIEGEIYDADSPKQRLSNAKEKAYGNLFKYDNIQWIYKKSKDASRYVPDGLDFVYIDGSHSYDDVRIDIYAWFPKVRDGGVLGGHDIDNGTSPPHDGVIKAVLEFVNKYNLQLHIGGNDWWVYKP